MSKAFLKDELPNDPFIVPPLADLPPGVPNRVTPRGLKLLEEKRAALEAEIERRRAAQAERDAAVPDQRNQNAQRRFPLRVWPRRRHGAALAVIFSDFTADFAISRLRPVPGGSFPPSETGANG
ncbi:MAG: hypothetical protein IMW86_05245 [Hydrogenibacillus sp.]|nr:hypothetical protein [Hydrogenibacillus sp.]